MYSRCALSLFWGFKNVRIPRIRLKSTTKFQKSLLPTTSNHAFISNEIILPDNLKTRTLEGINFDDYEESFGNKSTWEITRAVIVLQLCSIERIAENSLELMKWTRSVVGVRGLRFLFKPTFYQQFVGGETTAELRTCTRKLSQTGMRPMLAATMEEDLGEGRDETVYNNNCQRILDAIDIVTSESAKSPMIQLKLSGLLSADLLVTVGNFYAKNSNKLVLVKALASRLSGEQTNELFLDSVLDEKEKGSLFRAVDRLKNICIKAKKKGVKVLVDAECTYLNPGLDLLTMAAVATFNRDASVVWNTYQCYLKDARREIIEQMDLVTELGCYFGAKLVRGAYMSQERMRAKNLCTPDPICENYDSTCDNYNRILTFLLEKHSLLRSHCQFIVASHNEESIHLAVRKMEELNIDKDMQGVCFGQLYGMCDQVSNPLMKAGLPVYKSIPYGTIEEVLPYLARRAVENKSVLKGARKELLLLKKELKRRVVNKFHI